MLVKMIFQKFIWVIVPTVEVDAYNNRKFKGIVTQIASSNNGAASASIINTGTDVTNYKVYIRLLPESYKDLIDPSKPKVFHSGRE